jgi:hypothetical protein
MSRSPTRVSLKEHRDWRPDALPKDVVYIGRAVHRGGWHLPDSPFANHVASAAAVGHAEAARLYEEAMRGHLAAGDGPVSAAEIKGLAGHRLACFCTPEEVCHADVLIRLWHELEG